MTILVLTALLVLWMIGAAVAVSLCIVSARADRAEGTRRGGSLRLVASR